MNKKKFILIVMISLLYMPGTYGITFIQGVIQPWFTTIQNKTKIKLVITDYMYYPEQTKTRQFTVSPGDQYQTLWLTTALGHKYGVQSRLEHKESRKIDVMSNEYPLGREIWIQGMCRGSTVPTNTIIIGNTDRSTYANIPGGTLVIIQPRQCEIGISVPWDLHHTQ